MALTPEEQQMLVTQQLQRVIGEISSNTDLPQAAWDLIQKYVRVWVQFNVAQQIDWRPYHPSDSATWPKDQSHVWLRFPNGEIHQSQFIVGAGDRLQWAAGKVPAGETPTKWFYALSPIE